MTTPIEKELQNSLAASAVLPWWADADEIAAVMESLIFPGAAYVNGVALAVDNGMIAGAGMIPPPWCFPFHE